MKAEPTSQTLPADRAFVVQFSSVRRPAGRAEHVTSGANARFDSWTELQAFFESVLALTEGVAR